jgi:predicted kinase
MNYDNLIKFFFKDCPEIVQEMRSCNHHYDEEKGILNPYHLEGTVLTHTLMVIQQGEMRQVPDIIALGCLFHDFGKFDTRGVNHDKQRVSFYNHDAYSAFKAIHYMQKLNLSEKSIIRLFKMIALHTDLYRCDDKGFKNYVEKYRGCNELLQDLTQLATCDGMGRYTDETISPREQGVKSLQEYTQKMMKESSIEVTEKKEYPLESISLIGLPMSGKSTWIKNFLKENENYVVASRDDIILELGEGRSYNDAFAFVDSDKANNLFRERVSDMVKQEKNIIFDLTSLNRKSRRKSLSLLNSKYKKTAQVILCDLKSLELRNIKRKETESKFIKPEVIDRMIKSFYPPMYDEFDEINYLLSK